MHKKIKKIATEKNAYNLKNSKYTTENEYVVP